MRGQSRDSDDEDNIANFKMEDYLKWKGDQKQAKIQTLEKLAAYKRSEELIKLISEKIATCDDQSVKNYFLTKLKLTSSEYNDFIAQSIQTDVKSAKKSHFEKIISSSEQKEPAYDNTTLGVRSSDYTPANKSDYLPYHQERNVLNHSEYVRLKDAELEKEEWKLEFDLNEDKINEAIAQARANPSDPQKVEEEVEDEELLAMLNLDLNY